MEFAGQNHLRVLNLSEKCVGRNTRVDPVLNHVLCYQRMHEKVINMVVDEGRTRCKLAHNNLITVTLKFAISRKCFP